MELIIAAGFLLLAGTFGAASLAGMISHLRVAGRFRGIPAMREKYLILLILFVPQMGVGH